MGFPPNTFPQADTLVGPIVAQLILVARQIAGIGTCYATPPDAAPEDNSVLFPLREWRVLDDTNWKLKVELDFEVLHLFRRQNLSRAIPRAYAALPAWLAVLTAAENQSLGNLAILMNLVGTPGTIKGYTWGGTEFIAISHKLSVLTEQNIQ